IITGCVILVIAICFYCCLRLLKRSGIRELGYHKTKYERSKNILNEACPVCLEDFMAKESVLVSLCHHAFHDSCLLPWLRENNKCPLCKTGIGAATEHTPLTSTI
ncbi:hypothetical protein BOX15_Mlig001252g4, partial [Macrostomum lignano]